MDVLTLLNVEKLLSEIAFIAGAIKIVLTNFITSENMERFSVDRFFIDEMISENSSFPVRLNSKKLNSSLYKSSNEFNSDLKS